MSPRATRSADPVESTLTDRYQTTIPQHVRRRLKLDKGDRIRYRDTPEGVLIVRADDSEEPDPALGAFLAFLERDIATHPQRLVSAGQELRKRAHTLVQGVEYDLDEPLDPDDE